MPKLIKFSKLGLPSSRRDFYKNLFCPEFKIELSIFNAEALRKMPSILSFIHSKKNDSNSTKYLPIGAMMTNLVYRAQLFMLNQENDCRRIIINQTVSHILEILQWVYKYSYPEDKNDNNVADQQFWRFVSDTFKESIEYNYVEKTITEYFINLLLWNKILVNKDTIRNLVCTELDFSDIIFDSLEINTAEASKKAATTREELIIKAEKLYYSATEPDLSLAVKAGFAMTGMAIAYFDISSGLELLVQGLLASEVYGRSHRRLTKNIQLQILERQKDYIQKNLGEKLSDLNDWFFPNWYMQVFTLGNQLECRELREGLVTKCILLAIDQLYLSRALVEKRIEADYIVYVPSTDFPRIIIPESKIPMMPTRTQIRKMKPRPSLFSDIDRTEDKDRKREIKLGKDFKGWLVHGQGHSLFAVLPPANDSKISAAEVKRIVCAPRGPIAAKKFGQSGVKLRTDGRMCLKHDKFRILCNPSGQQKIIVNSIEQAIPAYTPVVSFYKK